MPSRRLHRVMLAWIGAFLAHQVGYGLASTAGAIPASPDHSYLAGASALVAPLLFTAVAMAVLGSVRERVDTSGLSVARLAGLQTAAFVLVDGVEHSIAGEPASLVMSPAVWLGVLVQPAVAWLVLRAIEVGVEVVHLASALRRGSTSVVLAAGAGPMSRLHAPATPVCRCSITARGPPSSL